MGQGTIRTAGATPADEYTRALSALSVLDPGVPQGEWVKIGMAAKAAGLTLEDFTAWSARSGAGNYKGPRDCADRWNSFDTSGGVTAGTLFFLAKQAGWQDPAKAERKKVNRALEHWRDGVKASADHPYIARKGGAPDGLRVVNWPLEGWGPFKGQNLSGWLMVPVVDKAGAVRNVQFIGPGKGQKLNGAGKMAGTFTLGKIEAGARAYVAEGIGHAWTVRKVIGAAAVVSFGKGNLRAAGEAVKAAGGVPVLVADRGAEAETERAAAELGAAWVRLPEDMPDGADINDLAARDGDEAAAEILRGELQAAAAPEGNSFRHNGLDLVRDDKRRPIWNMANALSLLEDHPDWRGVLGFNKFTGRRVLFKPMPGQRGGKYPRNIEDDDYATAQSWFNRNGFPKATAQIVVPAVRKVAAAQSFDPLVSYLDGLKWDGKRRIDRWLTALCGVEDSTYSREVGRRWLISAVARAYHPGCKADCMLVLEGPQGAFKSTALKVLAGEEWFTDALPPMNTKDASSFLRGRWIVEVAELEAMRREVDAIKAFITRTVESYRPSYGREEVDEPRRCIFAGTTNKDDWLKDETGGRRFWPVKVGTINVDGIARSRNQLWAEAVAAYHAGEPWHLEGEAAEAATKEQAERRAEDPWVADVMSAASGKSAVACKEILRALGFVPAEMTKQASDRVAGVLKQHGWRRDGKFTGGENKDAARYVPPA